MRAMSPVDHAWYRMDSPENLMMVHALMWTDEPLDWDVVRSDVAQGMLDRFPKFREHPVAAGVPLGRAGWEVDQDFDLDRHVVFHTLAGQGDRRALEEYVASQIPDPIDPAHPMWQVHCIDGFGSGSAVLFRMHHSIADGITLTRVLLSLTSTDDTHAGFVEAKSASGPVGLAVELSRSAASEGIRALRHPSRVVDATTAAVRGTRRLLHLATIPQKPRSALAGGVGCAKDVRWTDPWPLADVKAVSRAAGVTINDVLLSSLADALGLDAARTLDVIEQSSGQSWIGNERARRVLAGDAVPRAHMSLLAKDSALALAAAQAAGLVLPVAQEAADAFAKACRNGLADADDSALWRGRAAGG